MEQCERKAVAAHSDRVAEGDCAAVDVHLGGVDPEIGRRCDTNSGESLVQLEEVKIGNGNASFFGGEHGRSAWLMQE